MATGGSSHSRPIGRPLAWAASTSTSPRVFDPSAYSAQIVARCTVMGHTCPRQPRSARRPSTAARKSPPVYCSIIESSRLPPVWPASRPCSSIGNRASRMARASRSFRASVSAHLRTSPGGSTPSSSRSCPDDPPLSNMVTTACRSIHGLFLSPPRRLGNPVPPPKHPTLRTRSFTVRILPGVSPPRVSNDAPQNLLQWSGGPQTDIERSRATVIRSTGAGSGPGLEHAIRGADRVRTAVERRLCGLDRTRRPRGVERAGRDVAS